MRIAILGNAGSGKSTLAARLAADIGCPTLDLDTIFWEPGEPAVRRPPGDALRDLERFCRRSDSWVVEGCYEALIGRALDYGAELVFLDPGPEQCLANCRSRAWEPHKYASRALQDQQLSTLLEWVAGYYARSGEMSHERHVALYDAYAGPKRRLVRYGG